MCSIDLLIHVWWNLTDIRYFFCCILMIAARSWWYKQSAGDFLGVSFQVITGIWANRTSAILRFLFSLIQIISVTARCTVCNKSDINLSLKFITLSSIYSWNEYRIFFSWIPLIKSTNVYQSLKNSDCWVYDIGYTHIKTFSK